MRAAAAAEDLERLDELVEVVDLDRAVPPERGGEGTAGADERASVRERRARGGLRATDLEARDRLPRLGACAQRCDEGICLANRLEEEPDRLRPLVLGEEREVVGGVRDRLRP